MTCFRSISLGVFSAIMLSGAAYAADGKIYIMRHVDKIGVKATTPDDVKAVCNGSGLTTTGVSRATKVANEVSAATFQASYSSTACRTAYTAKIVSGLVPTPSLYNPSGRVAAFVKMAIDLRDKAGGDILLVLHSNWIEALFDGSAHSGGKTWPANQCYGEVRSFSVASGKWVSDKTFDDNIADQTDEGC